MSRPIVDQAEVAIEFPDKFYHGSFGRGSRFDVKSENDGIAISLERTGDEKRRVEFHIHYYLLEDILAAIAETLAKSQAGSQAKSKEIPEQHRRNLREAAAKLHDALK